MPDVREVAVLQGSGDVRVTEQDCPDPASGEVLVEVTASAISPGTIASSVAFRRSNPDSEADDRPLGYQNAGYVLTTGDDVDQFHAGDRVACMGAGSALHASHVVVPVNLCVVLPDDISDEEGAFVHLGATALHAVRRGDVSIGEYIAVIGLGLVGQFTVQLAQCAGAHPFGVDLFEHRVELARAAGIDHAVSATSPLADQAKMFTSGRGVDCGFICFGGDADEAVNTLVELAPKAPDGHEHGRIVVVGGASADLDFPVALGNMDIRASSRPGPGYHDDEWERGSGYSYPHVRWTTTRNMEEFLRYVDNGEVDVKSLLTHRVDFTDIELGYDTLIEDGQDTLGVVVNY